jgi:hypothetical protein
LQCWEPTLWATSPALLCVGFRVSRTICLGWLWTLILLIPASWIARITDISHHSWLFFLLLIR